MARFRIFRVYLSLLLCSVAVIGVSPGLSATVDHPPSMKMDGEGSFTAQLSGMVQRSIHGKAMFDIRQHADGRALIIVLYRFDGKEDFDAVNLVWTEGGLPEVGQYAIGVDPTVEAAYMGIDAGTQLLAGGEEGVLHLTNVQEGRIQGTFRFSGDIDRLGDETVSGTCRMEGSFDALRGDLATLPY